MDWRPSASLPNLERRAALMRAARDFFEARGVIEVETPVMAAAGVTEVALAGLSVTYDGPGAPADGTLWLQTSPEYAMKRLLAAGMGAIYQIARVFRGDERGRMHNPEFTLLEWYRPGFDHDRLMTEIVELVAEFLPARRTASRSYQDVFRDGLQLDPLTVTTPALRERVATDGLSDLAAQLDRNGLLDLLMARHVCPQLGWDEFTFVTDYPASQASLACLSTDDPRVAHRFELFIDGVEIANGYHELTDPAEQRARFAADQACRAAEGLPQPAMDERLLAALESGLPACAGVALGLDRLVMLALGASCIDEVIAFPVERA